VKQAIQDRDGEDFAAQDLRLLSRAGCVVLPESAGGGAQAPHAGGDPLQMRERACLHWPDRCLSIGGRFRSTMSMSALCGKEGLIYRHSGAVPSGVSYRAGFRQTAAIM
jgi:hypothetical protein